MYYIYDKHALHHYQYAHCGYCCHYRTFHASVLTDDPPDTRSHDDKGPAPNLYHVRDTPTKTSKLITGEAVFKSKTERSNWTRKVYYPGPGDYNPYDPILDQSIKTKKTANFQSKTKRELLTTGTETDNPGPGHYFQTPSMRSRFMLPYHKQKHYLCISAPAIPLPPLPPPPGPGHYEVPPSGSTEETQLVGGAVFKSNSSRWKGEDPLLHQPGPGTANGYYMYMYTQLHSILHY